MAKLSLELLNEKMELLELITRYAFAYDSGDIEGWYDLFTDDGVFSVYLPSRKEPLLLATSKEDLRQQITAQQEKDKVTFNSPYVTAFHLQSGTIFDELTTETASAKTMVHAFLQDCDDDLTGTLTNEDLMERLTLTPLFGGVYYSTFRKVDGEWKFSSRRFVASMADHVGDA